MVEKVGPASPPWSLGAGGRGSGPKLGFRKLHLHIGMVFIAARVVSHGIQRGCEVSIPGDSQTQLSRVLSDQPM